jgi:hypothetical protein
MDKEMQNLIDEIFCVLNNKTYSDEWFCDLLRAFNCVTHDNYYYHSMFTEFKGKAGQLFESFKP